MDADSNGTGPESPGRHLHVQNSKKRGQGRKHKNYFFFKFFFWNRCEIWCWFQWIRTWVSKSSTSCWKFEKTGVKVEKSELFFFQIFFLLSMQNLMLISKIQVPTEKVDILVEKNGKNDVWNVGIFEKWNFSKFFFLNWVKFDAEFNGNSYKSLLPHLHGEKVQYLSFFLKM